MFDGELIVCRNTESAVLCAPIAAVWKLIKTLDFAKIFPHAVKACNLLVAAEVAASPIIVGETVELGGQRMTSKPIVSNSEPCGLALAVGSLRRVEYHDGAVFVYKVAEISEVHHVVSFDLIEANPSIQVSGILHSIRLVEITETKETLIVWDSEFAGDCNLNFYQDQKWKKLDAFKALRHLL